MNTIVGIDTDNLSNEEIDALLLKWAATVLTGEVKFEDMVGPHLLISTVQIERYKSIHDCFIYCSLSLIHYRDREESDDFWTIFNDGC